LVTFFKRVMIHYHLNIQFFTTFPMWQGGPHLNLFLKNKKTQKIMRDDLAT